MSDTLKGKAITLGISVGQMNGQASSSGGSNPNVIITTHCAALTTAKLLPFACGLFAL